MSDDELAADGMAKDPDECSEDDVPPEMRGPRGPVLPGGIEKEILTEADPDNWKMPKPGDEVTVHYVGKLASDGAEFDSSRARDKPFVFTLGQGDVIPGWDKGLATMRKGELSKFTVQPEFAYGSSGQPPRIPQDATLVFEIELLSFMSKDDLFGDGGAIKAVLVEGKGWRQPRAGDEVVISLKAMAGESTVEEKLGFEYRLGSSALGALSKTCDAALQEMKKGEEAVIRCSREHSYADQPDGVIVTLKLEEMYETRDVSFRKDGVVMKKQIREGEDYNTPKETAKVTLSVSAAVRGGTPLAGFVAQALEFALGAGEVCDALECAAADMRRRERAILTVRRPALAAEPRLGLQDVAGDEPIVLTVELQDYERVKDTWDMSDDEKLAFCHERKAAGTALFKSGRLDLALARYEKVADVFTYVDNYPEEVKVKARELKQVCELNKAACYLKIKDHAAARLACNTVLREDKGNVKALYRRAQAEFGLKNFPDCIKDCKSAAEVDPQNREVRSLLKQAMDGQKEVDRQAKGMYSNMVKGLAKEKEQTGAEASRSSSPRPPTAAKASSPAAATGASRSAASSAAAASSATAAGSQVQSVSLGQLFGSLFTGMWCVVGFGLRSLFQLTGLSAIFGLEPTGAGPGAASAEPRQGSGAQAPARQPLE